MVDVKVGQSNHDDLVTIRVLSKLIQGLQYYTTELHDTVSDPKRKSDFMKETLKEFINDDLDNCKKLLEGLSF